MVCRASSPCPDVHALSRQLPFPCVHLLLFLAFYFFRLSFVRSQFHPVFENFRYTKLKGLFSLSLSFARSDWFTTFFFCLNLSIPLVSNSQLSYLLCFFFVDTKNDTHCTHTRNVFHLHARRLFDDSFFLLYKKSFRNPLHPYFYTNLPFFFSVDYYYFIIFHLFTFTSATAKKNSLMIDDFSLSLTLSQEKYL